MRVTLLYHIASCNQTVCSQTLSIYLCLVLIFIFFVEGIRVTLWYHIASCNQTVCSQTLSIYLCLVLIFIFFVGATRVTLLYHIASCNQTTKAFNTLLRRVQPETLLHSWILFTVYTQRNE
jgi:hypothetical protein